MNLFLWQNAYIRFISHITSLNVDLHDKTMIFPHSDQDDNFIEDFDLDALSSHLSWEDDSISSTSRWGRSSESEKVAPSRQEQSLSPPEAELQMDLEADFPVGKVAHFQEHHFHLYFI